MVLNPKEHYLNDRAMYQCLLGHEYDAGDETRLCQADKIWAGVAYRCNRKSISESPLTVYVVCNVNISDINAIEISDVRYYRRPIIKSHLMACSSIRAMFYLLMMSTIVAMFSRRSKLSTQG